MYRNSKHTVLFPLILAAGVVLGILFGQYLGRHDTASEIRGMLNRISSPGGKLTYTLSLIENRYVDSISMDSLTEHVLPLLVRELDPHSVYIPASEMAALNEPLEGEFDGVGVVFNMATDTVIVLNVVPRGPSDKAGVKAGDRILTINDSLVAGRKIPQNNIVRMLRGPRGSKVRLGLGRQGIEGLVDVEVERDAIPLRSIESAFRIADGIGYIKISKFGRTTYNEFITAIAKLKLENCKSFVIDLRSNTGGYMEAAVNMINEFMPEGSLIVYTEGKAFPRSDVYANGTGTCKDAPIVVLTDEISASASEIFAGAIQDNDRGLIIGRRTYGKGLVQSPISLSDGSEIRLTIARYYTPSGRCIQKQYTLGEGEEYDQDIYNRFMHGEFDSADSIKLDDHLKYQTAGGRTVYGGGGIMPDIFIPRDTSGISSYFTSVVNSGVLYLYALEYSDHHRKEFAAYKDYEELHAYLKQQPLLEDFTNFAAKKGIRKRPHLIAISGKLIEKQLQAYIVRNFFDDAGFYPIFLSDDVTLLRAVKVLQEGKSNPIFNTDGNLQSQASTPQGYGLFKEIIHEDAVAGLV